MPPNKLILRIESYGKGNKILDWIRSNLLGRHQKVRVNQAVLDWREVISGVPQGSVLSPLLFIKRSILFMDDLNLVEFYLSYAVCYDISLKRRL